MDKWTTIARLPGLLALTLLAAACSETAGPGPQLRSPGAIAFDVAAGPNNATFGQSGTQIIKGFNPTNPHHGDAIIATFFWLGSTNIIDSVIDVLTDVTFTPVHNTYNLVEYRTAGGISMATYVATNVQNFPDAGTDPNQILAVRANLSQSITDGGVMLSAYSGVYPTYAQALGAHQSSSGAGSSTTIADPGAIPVNVGALAYSVALATPPAGVSTPLGFTNISAGPMSDANMVGAGAYALPAAAGTVDPQWTWGFNAPSTWLASVLALNEAPTKLVFTVQPSTSLPCPATIPPVQVTAQDDKGNTVTTFGGPVTIAIGRNGGLLLPGTLSGTKTVAAVNGVARFSDLCIDQPSAPGNGYTLQATAPDLNLSVTSAAFGIGVVN